MTDGYDMQIFKTRTFARWARKEGLKDAVLRTAVDEIQAGLVDSNLGGGLLKKRVARAGSGKSGGHRTLLATNLRDRWVFLYGFSKNERDNGDDVELRALKRLAQGYLGMEEERLNGLLDAGELIEVDDGESKTA